MKIRIVQNPIVCGVGINATEYRKAIAAIAGQWVEVETDYLFQSQFNTVPIKGVSENGLRIMSNNVAEIQDDARIGRLFDRWTHKNYKNKQSLPKKVRNRENFKQFIFKFVAIDSKIALGLVPAYRVK